MTISLKTNKILWARSAGRCAICKIELVIKAGPNDDPALVGDICHIIARSEEGPRGRSPLNSQERDRYENLILLCKNDHKMIDDQPSIYPIEDLLDLKDQHEKWVEKELSNSEPWDFNISHICYLNIPRLGLLAARYGYGLDLSSLPEVQYLSSLGMELAGVMLAFEDLLIRIQPQARPLSDLREPDDKYIGLTCHFKERFRTKNVSQSIGNKQANRIFTGDLSRDPHIYIQFDGWKLAMVIDPRWITTSTAHAEFCPQGGSNVFSGLGTIKSIDANEGLVFATPLLLGIPEPNNLLGRLLRFET